MIVVRCPAKINLHLQVLGRRDDGFHELVTLFQAIDLFDRLELRPANELTMVCDAPGLACDGTNLVIRAATLLRASCGSPELGAAFTLRKTIPAGGGLGGGSSNAAGALLGCRALWNLEVPDATLRRLAAELGSDVPFFLTGGTAQGSGRGERIEPRPFVGPLALTLGCPPFGIPTAEVFRRFGATLTLPRNGVSVALLPAPKWPTQKDFGAVIEQLPLWRNDLETVVFEGWPELEGFRNAMLRSGAVAARVSGSGSTVYGVYPGRAQRDGALGELRERFGRWRIFASEAVESAAGLTEV